MIKWLARRLIGHISARTNEQMFHAPVLHNGALSALDPRKFAQIHVGLEAGAFYSKHLYNVPFFENYIDHLAEMARRSTRLGDGAILEFGVASGTTLKAIANSTKRQVIGFDSFAGLPSDWRDGINAGAFACEPPNVPRNAVLKIGRIENTLPEFLTEIAGSAINFIHIDTDLYEPAKFILDGCAPFMRDTIIVFDEFFNYPGWRDHEFKAFSEFQESNKDRFRFRYLGLGGVKAISVQVTRI